MESVTSAVTQWKIARAQGKVFTPVVHTGRARFDATYDLGKALGQGAFGEVHAAVHIGSGTRVAVKVVTVPPDARGSERDAYALAARRELDALCRLSHPHIVSVIEAFVPDDGDDPKAGSPTWLTVLELCEGCDLQTALDSHGALPVDVVRSIAAQLASAVEHMHAHGVVHRDITPANIIALGSDVTGSAIEIKLLDFGQAHGMDVEFVQLYTSALMRRMSARRTALAPRKAWATGVLSSLGVRSVSRDRSDTAMAGSWVARAGTSSLNALSAASFKQREWKGSEMPADDASPTFADVIAPPPPVREPTLKEQASRYSFTVEPSSSARVALYTAPEITDYHRFRVIDSRSPHEFGIVVDATVVVDAYSVGAVLKHLLTGVPPNHKVAEYIAQKTAHPVSLLLRVSRACVGRPVQLYRYMAELHDVDGIDVCQLLHQLTERDPAKRMTMTEFNEHPWVANADVASLREWRLSGHV